MFNVKNRHRAGFAIRATSCIRVSSSLEGEILEGMGHSVLIKFSEGKLYDLETLVFSFIAVYPGQSIGH